jgi:DnaJ-domain-containing protein 1
VTDYFALFGAPRRPWLDPEPLKQQFLALSAAFHPDHTHSDGSDKRLAEDRYSQINAAYSCLRSPKQRLSHLLQLERGTNPSELQDVPAEFMDLFIEVGETCKKADHFLAEKAAASSALLKAQLFERGQTISDELAALQTTLTVKREELFNDLKRHDEEWMQGKRHALLDDLEEIRRLLGFYDRWISQLQERFVQLAL